jgi:hypothetical protein
MNESKSAVSKPELGNIFPNNRFFANRIILLIIDILTCSWLFASKYFIGDKVLFLKGPRKKISFFPRKKYLLQVKLSVGFTSLWTVAIQSLGQFLKRFENVIPPPLILLKAHGVIKRILGNEEAALPIFLFKVARDLFLIQNTNSKIAFSIQNS